MYSFEGDFRRRPQQNLGGVSSMKKTDRESIILQSKQQRQKREEERKRLNSAIRIQAYVRSFLVRTRYKQINRDEFDKLFSEQEVFNHVGVLKVLMRKLVFFYDETKDIIRMTELSQLLLRHWQQIMPIKETIILIRKILNISIHLLKVEEVLTLAIPFVDVFTSLDFVQQCMPEDQATFYVGEQILYLVKRGYFNQLYTFLNMKTPPLYCETVNPPTSMCSTLFDLIRRPLDLIGQITVPNYNDMVMSSFAMSFLCAAYTEPIEKFVLPAICQDLTKFPYLALVQSLCDKEKFTNAKLVNNTWLLHAMVMLEPEGFVEELKKLNDERLPHNPLVLSYIKVIAFLSNNLSKTQVEYDFADALTHNEVDEEDDYSDSDSSVSMVTHREGNLLGTCIEYLNKQDRSLMMICSQISDGQLCDEFLESMSEICHNLLLSHKLALQRYRLLYTLAFKPVFLRGLWRWLSSMSHPSSFGGSPTPLLGALSRGMGADASIIGVERLLAPLAVFCALFSLLIGTLHDTEFCKDDDEEEAGLSSLNNVDPSTNRIHAFKFSELGALCRTLRYVCFGLVELAYPDTRPPAYDPYHIDIVEVKIKRAPAWSHLFKVCTHLVRALYVRSSRLHFCRESEWSIDGIVSEGALAVSLVVRHGQEKKARANAVPYEEGPPLTTKELRTVMILREIPFIVPFATRVFIFQGVLQREKQDHFYELSNFNEGPVIHITVRRSHLYEDAFDKLSPANEPDLKLKLRVQLINQAGADEAGVDGGGLFREFLSELLKSAFDPNRGLFRLTKDNMLYPNPGVSMLYEDYPMHYFFVGRMLGKALYENLLVELPLAEFFLEKLCSSRDPDVHALASLDPALYRGLLMLRSHRRQDVQDLGLDFTMLTDELGAQKINELKPGGANIPVTAENRIEYIHLVADYKLNKQIRVQCSSFKRGLTSVISSEWLRMFSCRELQLLISGAEVPIDVDDLRLYTLYSGVFNATHPTVVFFWKAVEAFTDDQRRMLLKFVTSCSRPPLLGFKELQPPFCIQSAGAGDRLPSASTCMNLLKLPEFDSQALLHERLLYAIQSGAGFELS